MVEISKNNKLAINGGTPVRKEKFPKWPVFDESWGPKLVETLKSGGYSGLNGPKTKEFGELFAKKYGAKYGIPVANGTVAIHLALIGLGINPGDEILVPTHTFIGSATPILMQNAIPVFVDVDSETYTMDPKDMERKITKKSKAVIVVHLNGNPANMDKIMKIAKKHNLKVIEDCAQAHGARYGKKFVGAIGDVATFSFWEDKIMTTAGEGGMIITSDEKIAEKMKFAASHGEVPSTGGGERKYLHEFLGYNYRLTEFQSEYGILELGKIDEYVRTRKNNAAYLSKALSKMKCIRIPKENPKGDNAFYKYVVKIDAKNLGKDITWIRDALNAEGIPATRRYPIPLHLQPVFKNKKTYGDSSWPYDCCDGKYEYKEGLCPTAEKLAGELLSLQIHPALDKKCLDDTIAAFKKVIGAARAEK